MSFPVTILSYLLLSCGITNDKLPSLVKCELETIKHIRRSAFCWFLRCLFYERKYLQLFSGRNFVLHLAYGGRFINRDISTSEENVSILNRQKKSSMGNVSRGHAYILVG